MLQHEWTRRILLLLAGLAVALALGEATLRLFKPKLVWTSRQPAFYVPDDEVGSTYRPNAEGLMHRSFEIDNLVRTNSLGFHDTEHDPLPGALHVAALGDSFTAAFEVPVEKTWTQVLQRLLREKGFTGAEVVNLGADHCGTDVHVTLLERYLTEHRPRLVLLAFYENDVADARRGPFYREAHDGCVLVYGRREQREALIAHLAARRPGPLGRWLFENIFVWRALHRVVRGEEDPCVNNIVALGKQRRGKKRTPEGEATLDPHLNALKGLAEQHGFTPLIIPVPPKDLTRDSLERLRAGSSPELLETLAVVNVLPEVSRRLDEAGRTHADLYWKTDGHFNAYGNELYARAVAEALTARLDPAEYQPE